MAKKSGGKKETSKLDRAVAKQSEEIGDLASGLKKIRKDNDRLAGRLRKLEKDDTLAKRVRAMEKENTKSLRKVESLAEELKKTRSAATSVKRRKGSKASSRNGKQRPNEESEPIITKAAEKAAVELGVNLSGVRGTGTEGRITVRDVRKRADKRGAKKTAKSRKTSKR